MEADFERPDEALIAEHGHFHLRPRKHAGYRAPAQPAGRSFVVRHGVTPEGKRKTWVDWAPWLEGLSERERQALLLARATQDDGVLKHALSRLGITDLADPVQWRRVMLYGLQDRVETLVPDSLLGPLSPSRLTRLLGWEQEAFDTTSNEMLRVYDRPSGRVVFEETGE